MEESNIKFIELCHEVQQEIVKLKHEDMLRSIKLQKLIVMQKFHEQVNIITQLLLT
jgi:predicted nucleotide-binding protein